MIVRNLQDNKSPDPPGRSRLCRGFINGGFGVAGLGVSGFTVLGGLGFRGLGVGSNTIVLRLQEASTS